MLSQDIKTYQDLYDVLGLMTEEDREEEIKIKVGDGSQVIITIDHRVIDPNLDNTGLGDSNFNWRTAWPTS